MQRSKPSRVLALVVIAVAAVGSLAWSPAPRATRAGAAAAVEALEQSMEEMNSLLRALGKGLEEKNRDKALEQVSKFQTAVLVAKLRTPPEALKLEEAKRPEFVAGFRKKLIELLAVTCKLEMALLERQFDEANRLVKDELPRLKQEGHDAYQGDEEK
jgi:hypothetical protein